MFVAKKEANTSFPVTVNLPPRQRNLNTRRLLSPQGITLQERNGKLETLLSPNSMIDTFMDSPAHIPTIPDETQTPPKDVRTFIQRTADRFRQLGFSEELSARLLSPKHHGVDFSMET
ncbi:hypothetical protein A3C37_01245 [Candidatus Peribacteria bacterium RIFCSPHIGHO2_02_FULL_53_20]|nr:MAG: hypothetical protein A3C37_01245 [Candidatus Peribacteria bacterium RIFCSPHIGHO2_02_FULL_53_20]OGJ68291.1 MAG: hypothetical protein A3B61_01665 [Candidatus Peribacteria bacterium RIFCSPLOWO2_01_FULL_53_10]OGJ73634.1 MAG: hypothetical protein A3G69_00590 [Candidatus Peribacteria bacterium RIFCSPLOWO2_12_FULL_53_10]